MRHLQERTMSLEAQVRDLLALQPNGLHRGPQGRDEVPRGDRALHGRGQVDGGEDRDWKSQVEHIEKLLQEQESLGKRPWFQYGSAFDNKEGGQGRHDGASSVWDKEVDSLRSTNIQLPSLPQHTGKDTGLVCGDWLAQIRPLLGDMSSGALEWWDEMMEVVLRRYHQWLEAGPLDRLSIEVTEDSSYNRTRVKQRMDLRASSLLLTALPSNLKEELISTRQLAAGAIVFRILKVYQPGGAAERADTLAALTVQKSSKDARDACERLRRWRRHQLRALELKVSLRRCRTLHC